MDTAIGIIETKLKEIVINRNKKIAICQFGIHG